MLSHRALSSSLSTLKLSSVLSSSHLTHLSSSHLTHQALISLISQPTPSPSQPSPRHHRSTPSQPTPSVKLSSLSSSSHLSISQPTPSQSQPTPLPSLPTPSPSHAVAAPAHTSAHAVPADPLQVSALSSFVVNFFI